MMLLMTPIIRSISRMLAHSPEASWMSLGELTFSLSPCMSNMDKTTRECLIASRAHSNQLQVAAATAHSARHSSTCNDSRNDRGMTSSDEEDAAAAKRCSRCGHASAGRSVLKSM